MVDMTAIEIEVKYFVKSHYNSNYGKIWLLFKV